MLSNVTISQWDRDSQARALRKPLDFVLRPCRFDSGRGLQMVDLDLWRTAAVALDEYACNGDKGRDKRDPVYLEVTENRDGILIPYEKYSSCADRAHWKLWRLGVRSQFVNREERTPLPGDWHVGVNISELWNAKHGAPAEIPNANWLPEPGDELLIWNTRTDAHSLSIMSYDPVKREARTANYGEAGMSKSTFPGAKCSTAPLVYTPQGWLYGISHKRKVQRVIKLAKVIPLITVKPNFKNSAGEYIFGSGELLDALEAIVP